MFNIFKKKNTLTTYAIIEEYGDYDFYTVVKKKSIEKIIDRIKSFMRTKGVYIENKFNGLYYPFFDLDDKSVLSFFKRTCEETGLSYVIFQSSENHYWALLDKPYKSIDKEQVYKDTFWRTCNDGNFVAVTCDVKRMYLRGTYENMDRVPFILEKHGELSDNLINFVNTLRRYYDNDGFEISFLMNNDDQSLINQFIIKQRKDKVSRILK